MDSTCKQCGKDTDLSVAFTKHKVCLACAKENYLEATGRKKKGKK